MKSADADFSPWTGWLQANSRGDLYGAFRKDNARLYDPFKRMTLGAFWHDVAWLMLLLYRLGYVKKLLADHRLIFGLLTRSILLTWLYNFSHGSILFCAIFNATINMAFMSGNSSMEIMNIMGTLITFGEFPLCLLRIWKIRRMLSRRRICVCLYFKFLKAAIVRRSYNVAIIRQNDASKVFTIDTWRRIRFWQ